MTKLMNLVAAAALTTVGVAPALAQSADPFVSSQDGISNLSDEQIAAGIAAGVLVIALVLDESGNVVGTTVTTTTTTTTTN